MNTLLETARRYVGAGLSVLPVATDGSKSPASCIKTWTPYQKRFPTDTELSDWFKKPAGIAVIFGAVSGNAECLDFDEPGLFDEYEQLAEDNDLGDLLRRLPLVETPSGGRHLYFRCETPVGKNTPLARIEDEVSRETTGAKFRDGKYWKVRTRIETRGEGGYAVVPPSPAACHPDNRPYVLLRGSLTALPVLTDGERIALHRLASVFNAYQLPQPAEDKPKASRRDTEGLSPGDDFNARGDVLELLQRHGAQVSGRHGETVLIKRPGKSERGHSATWNHGNHGYLFMFTSNWFPFEPDRAYSAFAVYALLEHSGDFHAAARALYAAGYGDRTSFTAGIGDSLPTPPEPEEDAAPRTLEAWKKRGKRLANWKSACDDLFRWRAGDWWNAADVEWGGRFAFLEEKFGKGFGYQIPKFASVCKAFPADKRTPGVPFWVYQELAAQPDETRTIYLQRFQEGGLNREALRAELGTVPSKREPKGWLAVRQLLPSSLADELVTAIATEGSPVIVAKMRAALGLSPQFHEGTAAEEDYPPDWADTYGASDDAVSGRESVHETDAETADSLLKSAEYLPSNSSAGGRIGDTENLYETVLEGDREPEFLPMDEEDGLPPQAADPVSDSGHWNHLTPATDADLKPLVTALQNGELEGRQCYLRVYGASPMDKAVRERLDLLRRVSEGEPITIHAEGMTRKQLASVLRQWRAPDRPLPSPIIRILTEEGDTKCLPQD